MKLAIALLAFNLIGCAAGVGQRPSTSSPTASHPTVIRDGLITPDTGSGSGGPVVHPPRPNV